MYGRTQRDGGRGGLSHLGGGGAYNNRDRVSAGHKSRCHTNAILKAGCPNAAPVSALKQAWIDWKKEGCKPQNK